MPFAAGLLVGLAAGGALVVVLRQAAHARLRPNATLATALAVLALVLAIIAVARSGDTESAAPDQSPAPTTPAPTPAPTTTVGPPPGSSTTTTVPGTITVPNLVGLPRAVAVSQITGLGLKPDVETLSLANVPTGYVVSQTPLAASRLAPGSTVVIVVSAAA